MDVHSAVFQLLQISDLTLARILLFRLSTRINNGISYCNELKIYSLEFQFCTLLYKAVEIGEGTIHFSTIIIFYFEREIMMSLVKAVTHKWSFKKVDHERKKNSIMDFGSYFIANYNQDSNFGLSRQINFLT